MEPPLDESNRLARGKMLFTASLRVARRSGRGRIPLGGAFPGICLRSFLLRFYLGAVMANCATNRCARHRMMAGYMACHPAYGGSFDATLGVRHSGDRHQKRCQG